jgi:hypothetical protein
MVNKKQIKQIEHQNKQQGKYSQPDFVIAKRPSNPLNRWIKESKNSYQITKRDVCYIYRNIIFAKSFGQLKEIMENESKRDKYPALVIAIIAGVLGDIARGNIINITRIMQMVFPSIETEFISESGGMITNSYEEMKALEDSLRNLEGDDAIEIIDKLIIKNQGTPVEEGSYQIQGDNDAP